MAEPRGATCECGHKGFNHGFGAVCLFDSCECLKFMPTAEPNDPLPARVSDEDRRAAVAALREAYDRMPSVFSHDELADTMTDAAIAHGWGPKARVSGAELTGVLVGKWPGGTRVLRRDVIAFLRECGIEVTE